MGYKILLLQDGRKKDKMNVLLPAYYDKEKTYPVLYLLHGYYDDENSLAYDNFINDLE